MNNKLLFANIAFAVFSLFCLCYFSCHKLIKKPNLIYYKTTPYNFINVTEFMTALGPVRNVNYGFSIIFKNSAPDNYFASYITMFHHFFVNKQERSNNLLLGNATGSSLAGLLYYCDNNNIKNINFDVVEIDKEFTKVGEKYFNLPKNDARIKYFYDDARVFLNTGTEKKYDIVFFDIYTSGTNIVPYYLITKETYEKIYNIMADNGILMMNVIGNPYAKTKSGEYLRQVYTNIKSVFPDTRIYMVERHFYNVANYIIAAYKNPNDKNTQEIQKKFRMAELRGIKESSEVFTDNYSPVEKFLEFN